MKNFLNQKWVRIVAYIFIAIGSAALILGGTSVAEIAKIPTLVAGIISAVGLLIVAIIGKNKSTADETKN